MIYQNGKGYVREHWTEIFAVYVPEGWVIPRFYLPVRRYVNRLGAEVWILPLAPFALVWFALCSAAKVFWYDLLWQIEEWRKLAYKKQHGT